MRNARHASSETVQVFLSSLKRIRDEEATLKLAHLLSIVRWQHYPSSRLNLPLQVLAVERRCYWF